MTGPVVESDAADVVEVVPAVDTGPADDVTTEPVVEPDASDVVLVDPIVDTESADVVTT